MPLPGWPSTSPGSADPTTGEPSGETPGPESLGLIQTATISRCTITTNAEGGRTKTWEDRTDGEVSGDRFYCRVAKISAPGSHVRGAAQATTATVEIWMNVTVEVRIDDQITVDGITYDVLDTDYGTADARVLLIYCRRNTPY